jgi:hypothetical protein
MSTLVILHAGDNPLKRAPDGTYRIETIPGEQAARIARQAAEVRLDPGIGPREKNALALLLGTGADYTDAGGRPGWQPGPGGAALAFQIYRGTDSDRVQLTEAELRRAGYEFRLITRVS